MITHNNGPIQREIYYLGIEEAICGVCGASPTFNSGGVLNGFTCYYIQPYATVAVAKDLYPLAVEQSSLLCNR
jgi:hypothetical protein